MSGHSKWASIKHKKGAADAKKGKVFTKIAANIYSAARQGGGDADKNFRLRLAIDQAKAANMPSANIDRAIKKGTGELGGAAVEEILYEGYGPSGTAILIEAATDNRNRTSGEVRTAFTKSGGSLGESGSVGYLFEKKGQVQLAASKQELKGEDLELAIIDSGAEDFEENDEEILIYTKPNELMQVVKYLKDSGVKVDSAELTYIPKTEVNIDDKEKAKKVLNLMDTLEDLDDVLNVSSNFNIDESILNELS
ncbi:YebC/PmpR family DNA-binding transcriptional regulator [bacterium (Candidatus Howlettbacteria) CG_4_10_14_0_8_um_filter_40_9]|nr:MAG: YebC/PmpR family DNA-binding transcriptional regulator [bacterium (Candidatus Howlettbacteria) CG_4_10_14_0_8_um_filter_40_9]